MAEGLPATISILEFNEPLSDPDAIALLQDALALVRKYDALQVTVSVNFIDTEGRKEVVRRRVWNWPKW